MLLLVMVLVMLLLVVLLAVAVVVVKVMCVWPGGGGMLKNINEIKVHTISVHNFKKKNLGPTRGLHLLTLDRKGFFFFFTMILFFFQ